MNKYDKQAIQEFEQYFVRGDLKFDEYEWDVVRDFILKTRREAVEQAFEATKVEKESLIEKVSAYVNDHFACIGGKELFDIGAAKMTEQIQDKQKEYLDSL